MQKILSFSLMSFALYGSMFCATLESSGFDMSELKARIDEIAYNNNANLTLDDFCTDMFVRYNGFQAELVKLQQENPLFNLNKEVAEQTEFGGVYILVNNLLVSLLSSEGMLRLSYLSLKQKFNSEEDLTLEIIQSMLEFFKNIDCIKKLGAGQISSDPSKIRHALYKAIKLEQKSREAFYEILLRHSELKSEYEALLRGEKTSISDNFYQKIIDVKLSFDVDCFRDGLLLGLGKDEKDLSEIDKQTINYILESVKQEVVGYFNLMRPLYPLLIKYFGEIKGIGF